MDLNAKIESILFVASQPLKIKQLAKALEVSKTEIKDAISFLRAKYNKHSGVVLIGNNNTVQLVTNPDNSEYVEKFVKQEIKPELTKAQLETMSVIAYRQPITRPELEQIRGVNCAIILRNLLIRGLIVEKKEALVVKYELSLNALRYLGLSSVEELPDYEKLSQHENIQRILEIND